MEHIKKKDFLWILPSIAAFVLVTVLFVVPAGICGSELLLIIASLLFYAAPIAIAAYVFILARQYVEAKAMESKSVGVIDANIELLKEQIEQIESKADKIAEMLNNVPQ
jgi:Zn-dependent protease with chaperone function